MARIRSVKPEMRRSRTVCSWPIPVRYTFVGLLGYLDDYGRGIDDPRLVKAELYPIDDEMTPKRVHQHLDVIAERGPLCRYEVDGEPYIHIVSWSEHQRVNRPTDSRIPHCPKHECAVNGSEVPHDILSEDVVRDQGGLTTLARARGAGSREGKGKENYASAADAPDPPSERADVERLCTHLADRIEANGVKRPTIGKSWRDSARLMLDRDGRSEDKIHAAIDWCQDDEFWRGNVLSMPTLREKYDQLRLHAARGKPAPPGVTTTPTPTAPRLADLCDEHGRDQATCPFCKREREQR